MAGCPAGVYLVDAAQRDAIFAGKAIPASTDRVILDGNLAESREEFFTEIARAMHFPDYFGRNWDAVYDCLTDPSLLPDSGVAILFDGFDRFAATEHKQWQTALKVFADACAFWAPLDRPLYILLYGAEDRAPGTPRLPHDCLGGQPDEDERAGLTGMRPGDVPSAG
jgi:RNAse (barnase) inhibitor barstar